MKKVTLFFAMFFIAITLNAQVEPTDTDGNGYCNISTLDHLRWVSENDSCWTWNFELDNDINASDTKNWNVGDHDNDTTTANSEMGWLPIGIYRIEEDSTPFTGRFDGHDYAIDSLYINRPNQSYVGLFGYVVRSQINNLGISNCNVVGIDYVGALIGYDAFSSITNCYSSGNVFGRRSSIGGLLGSNNISSSIINSYSAASVTGNQSVGGLVGLNYNNSTIINSYSTGMIKGYSRLGGLVGYNHRSAVINSYAAATVTGVGNNVGGFIGENYSASITNSFWDKTVSGKSTSAGEGEGTLEAKTTTEMKTQSTFTDANWDFETIWAIDGITNDGYPFFGTTTGVVTENILPTTNLTCSPNPCNTSSKIGYSINNATFVNIAVYDMLGNEVTTLINDYQSTGNYEVVFNVSELANGVYFVSINTPETMETRKIIVAR